MKGGKCALFSRGNGANGSYPQGRIVLMDAIFNRGTALMETVLTDIIFGRGTMVDGNYPR